MTSPPEGPVDLHAFWERTLAAERARPADPVFTPAGSLRAAGGSCDVFGAGFTGARGHRIKGWLIVPCGPRINPCVVQFLGYGQARAEARHWLRWPDAGFATLVMDTRGQGTVGGTASTPDPVGPRHPQAPGFVTRGVLDPDGYYYRDVYVDAVRAVDAALVAPRVDPARVAVSGCSQGGQLAVAAAALQPAVAAALVESPFLSAVPAPGDLPDRQPYRELLRFCRDHPRHAERAMATLRYFDVTVLAARATCPALYSVAERDTRCPPGGGIAAYRCHAGTATLRVWPGLGHTEPNPALRRRELEFLRQHLAAPAEARLAAAQGG